MAKKILNKFKNWLKNKKVLALIGLGILWVFFLSRRNPGKIFAVQKVGRGTIEEMVSSSGTVQSENEVKVFFQTSGKLVWLGVKEGDLVRKGQALASLDKESLQKNFQKYLNLYLTNRWDFEQQQENYKTIRDNKLLTDEMQRILDKYQFSLNNAVLDVETADLAVKYATIYSPISGIVTKTEPSVAGINILPTTAYIEVADPQKMEFQAIIDETDIGKLKAGQPTVVTLDAFPGKEFLGTIKRIAFKSIMTTSGGTGFTVYVSLPVEEIANFKIGLNGDFKAVTQKKEAVIAIPLDALIEKDDKKFVFRFLKGKAVKTEIETGLMNDEVLEVTTGLNEGDQVIIEDVNQLTDGQKITVK